MTTTKTKHWLKKEIQYDTKIVEWCVEFYNLDFLEISKPIDPSRVWKYMIREWKAESPEF